MFDHFDTRDRHVLLNNALRAASPRPGTIKLVKPQFSSPTGPTGAKFSKAIWFTARCIDRRAVEAGQIQAQDVQFGLPVTDFQGRDLPHIDRIYSTKTLSSEQWLDEQETGFSMKSQQDTVQVANWLQSLLTAAATDPTIAKLYVDVLLQTLGVRCSDSPGKHLGSSFVGSSIADVKQMDSATTWVVCAS